MVQLVTMPSGEEVEFPDEMSDVDIERALSPKAGAVANTGLGALSKVGKQLASYGMALPNAIRDLSQRQPLGTTSKQMGGVVDESALAMGARPEATSFGLGEGLVEAAETAAPVAAVARRVAGKLPQAVGRARNLAANVGVNAGFEGGRTAAEGGGIRDVMASTALGGLGAGAGHALGGFLQRGARPVMNKGAEQLLDAGVTPTYGQMMGRAGSQVENAFGYVPVIGGAIDRARGATMKQFSRAEVNRVLKDIGFKTDLVGEDAVQAGRQAVSDAYERATSQVELPYFARPKAANAAVSDIRREVPLLSESNAKSIQKLIDERIMPRGGNSLDKLSGEEFKKLDRELGELIRERSGDLSDTQEREMAKALRIIQHHIRDQVEPVKGASAKAVQDLKDANRAFREMVPIREATETAAKDIGEFNPVQLHKAQVREGVAPGPLDRPGRELLPTSSDPWRRVSQVGGGTAATLGSAGTTVPIWAGANLAYSQPARRFVAEGLKGRKAGLPFTMAQLGSQVGARSGGALLRKKKEK